MEQQELALAGQPPGTTDTGGTADLGPTIAPGMSARKLLVDWANKQDGWMRMLAADVLASRQPASQAIIEKALAQYLSEKSLVDDKPVPFAALELDDEPSSEAASFVIERLTDIKGVNALSVGQAIDFNSRLTVLFGENGAGKTGYARILKTLAAVRTAEPILPNVHEPSAPVGQGATITYSSGGTTTPIAWRGDAGIAPFTYMGIFDTKSVRLHVDDELPYVYTPSDLALFPLLNAAISEVRTRLDALVRDRKPASNPFLSHFTRGTTIYVEIETLGAATEKQLLTTAAVVSSEEEAQLEELKTRLIALKNETIPAQQKVVQGRRELYGTLIAAATTVRTFDSEVYRLAATTAKTATEDYATLRTELFGRAGLDGEGDVVWQDFVLGGETYREHIAAHEYPQQGDRCLYCQQSLGTDAIELLRRYRDFANDAARKRAEDATRAADVAARDVSALNTAQLATEVSREQGDEATDPFLISAGTFLDGIKKVQQALSLRDPLEVGELTTLAASIEAEATKRRAAAIQLLSDLDTRAQGRKVALQEAQTDHDGLRDRLELKQRLDAILVYIDDAKWVQRATQLIKKYPQLLKALTEVSKIASDQLLNTDFENHFKEECKALRAPAVDLDFPGRQSQAARRKMTASHKPSAVLSEGEQKVIALADFLAESALRLTPAPLVFDDPVNSLDYRRIHEVANRVAALAEDRQVIVFTHNIWFATELLSRFESKKEHCSYFGITDEPTKGLVVAGTHPRWDTVKETTKKINKIVETARPADGSVLEALVRDAYGWIRTWCEVVVEIELLAGVAQRYQPNVMMGALSRIKIAHLEAAVGVIIPLFDKACRYIDGHSQPLETLGVRPGLEELETDWKALQAARKAYIDATP
jgi:ABC-type transport system involved in cytochrome c biogenesis ATPase subunit